MSKKLVKICPICGIEFQTYISQNKITCSKDCRYKRQSITNKGENNPNYGKRWSEEKRKEFSIYQQSVKDEMSEKIKKSWEGADERRKNTSELQSALGKERIGEKNPFYGKKHTDETKDKIKLTFEKIGRKIPDSEKTDYTIYYEQSDWIDNMFDLIENGMSMLLEHGVFNHSKNTNGVVRDHMLGRRFGYENKIFPEILRHPANCQIIKNSDNVSKAHTGKKNHKIIDSILTIEELFQKIKEYKNEWAEHDIVLNLVLKYENGERWQRN